MMITGRLADGALLDYSGENNEFQRVKVDTLLPTVSKIISQQKVGSELEIILPAERRFGDEDVGTLILPGTTLIFIIKLAGVSDMKVRSCAVPERFSHLY